MEFNFKKYFLNEMPIDNLKLIGKWGNNDPLRRFTKIDAGILTSPKGVEKIKQKWSRTEYNFNLYFVREKNAWKESFVGEVNIEYVKQKLNLELPELNDDSITIIYTNNIGQEKQPLTGWTLAHRFSHALVRNEFYKNNYVKELTRLINELKEDFGLKFFKEIDYYYNLGTMKSCRERNLATPLEFQHELFAQFIINGKINFNKYENWKFVNKSDKAFNSEINQFLEIKERDFDYQISSVLGTLHNKIFIV
jgi:hypothetical protein